MVGTAHFAHPLGYWFSFISHGKGALKMDKDVATAMAFETATDVPEELRAAAVAHKENYLKLQKAQAQIDLWTKELEVARVSHARSLKSFRQAMSDYLPQISDPVKEEL